MMRITPTELDQLVWFKRLEDMTLQDLVSRLRREAPANRAMEIGTAWHSVLEDPPLEGISIIEHQGYTFVVDCDAEVSMPQVREIRSASTYNVDGVSVTLEGGVDGITGNVITDHKLTARPDPEKYFDSMQWRAYMDIYGADVFEYVLYHAKDEGERIIIRDVQRFRLYRYPEMRDDLMTALREFVEFARAHLPERFTEAA